MDQKISIKIAGRTFNLTAPTPETEQLYRQAAEAINKRFATFTRSHPGKTASDLLSLVALNEAVIRLLSDRFAVPKSRISLVYGETSRLKTFEIPDP